MGLVTDRTAVIFHGIRVRQMTIPARLNLAMIIMAGSTGQGGMDTRIFP